MRARGSPERPAVLEPNATRLQVPGHQRNAIGRPMPGLGPGSGHRIEELFATGLRMNWHGVCNQSPDAFAGTSGVRGSFETATIGTRFSDLHRITLPSLINGHAPFSIHKSGPIPRIINPEIAPLVNLPISSL